MYWVANKLVKKSWAISCIRKAGLPPTLHPLSEALEDDENRERLIQAVLEQKAIFASLQKMPPPPPAIPTFKVMEDRKRREAEKAAAEAAIKSRWDKSVSVLKRTAKICRKLHNKMIKRYQDKVDAASERKASWLRPLMWEALANIQTNYNGLRKKKEFYKRAKDTPCFDCDVKESDPKKMTYDHLRDKHFNIGSIDFKRLGWKRLHMEIGKCDVVCRSCHDIREYLRGRWDWSKLGSREQHRISSMCYLERELYYQVITRECKNPNPIDGESLRKTKLVCEKILSAKTLLGYFDTDPLTSGP